jgi:hypothetical protein
MYVEERQISVIVRLLDATKTIGEDGKSEEREVLLVEGRWRFSQEKLKIKDNWMWTELQT